MGPVTWQIDHIVPPEPGDKIKIVRVDVSAGYHLDVSGQQVYDSLRWTLRLPWQPTLTIEQIEAQAWEYVREHLPQVFAALPGART